MARTGSRLRHAVLRPLCSSCQQRSGSPLRGARHWCGFLWTRRVHYREGRQCGTAVLLFHCRFSHTASIRRRLRSHPVSFALPGFRLSALSGVLLGLNCPRLCGRWFPPPFSDHETNLRSPPPPASLACVLVGGGLHEMNSHRSVVMAARAYLLHVNSCDPSQDSAHHLRGR